MPSNKLRQAKKARKARKTKTAQAMSLRSQTYSQLQSPLFRLPLELRFMIYTFLFSSTRLSWGLIDYWTAGNMNPSIIWDGDPSDDDDSIQEHTIKLFPKENSLVLLRVCHRVRFEIGDTWLKQVLFSFTSPEAVLDKLTAIPRAVLSKIRHLRVYDRDLELFLPDSASQMQPGHFNIAYALRTLAGLKLDRLTILSDRDVFWTFCTVETVTRFNGWKELHYIHRSDKVVAEYRKNLLFMSPEFLSLVWTERDRPSTEPSVEFRPPLRGEETGGGGNAQVIAAGTGGIPPLGGVQQAPALIPKPEADEAAQDRFGRMHKGGPLARLGVLSEETQIIVKRGKGVDYETKRNAGPADGADFRNITGTMSWKRIKAMSERIRNELFPPSEHRGSFQSVSEPRWEEQEDEYEDPEDHWWM
ncbi:hypothetical protein B0T17DRAFT_544361 [Bombardia bombarda]|uniref:DUF7730 domain-containing protein n=1 Tax=Bombardia bombarda TaxID=252184 RepID=A0AA39W9T2_9PEZI|nr:hypothetical protein B0T17DRAFT_544361 [Bombardia bombarda]